MRTPAPPVALAAALTVVALMLLTACSDGGSAKADRNESAAVRPAALGQPCGLRDRPPDRWEHVVWIWLENHSYGEVLGPPGSEGAGAMPFLNDVSRACGTANDYYTLFHPSVPNYIAAVSGDAHGIDRTCLPTECPITGRTLFDQLGAEGRSWRTYAQAMPEPCALQTSGLYTPGHNPATYFTPLRSECERFDLPFGDPRSGPFARELAEGGLAAFTLLVPDRCSDAHDCPPPSADAWLHRWLPRLTSSPDYRDGRTVIFITWDEGSGGEAGQACPKFDGSCHVATLVVSPATPKGSFSDQYFTHYSLLKTTEQLLGLPLLGHARDANVASMRKAFGL